MKRLVVCSDGTWQSLESPYPTNVIKIAQAIKPIASDTVDQVIYYDEGIGTGGNILTTEDLKTPLTRIGIGAGLVEKVLEAAFGGAFGKGIDKNIQDAYRFLCLNYAPGDEIYLFGFSRGAYTVRSLAGMLYYSGLLKRPNVREVPRAYELYRAHSKAHDPELVKFRQEYCVNLPNYPEEYRVPITLLGCWDTVGSLGIPDIIPFLPGERLINKDRYKFHDTCLSSIIQYALHAVAVDEARNTFSLTPMNPSSDQQKQRLRQVWFPGEHGCIGGGDAKTSGLSDGALQWMMEAIGKFNLKLEFDTQLIPEKYKLNPQADCSYASQGSLRQIFTTIAGAQPREIPKDAEIHPSVQERIKRRSDYRPVNLKGRLW